MQSVTSWLETFAERVRECAPQQAEALFAEDVLAFGTVADTAYGRRQLRAEQWDKVWPATRGFRFHDEGRRIVLSPDGLMAMVNALWSSESVQSGALRTGRVTLVLRRAGVAADWLAVHSHFSRTPDGQV